MKRWISIVVMAAALAVVGCKKDKKNEGTTGSDTASGSAMAGSGSAMAGSAMAGSGSAMAGSGSAMAGSGADSAGSGSSMAGSGSAAGARPAVITDEMLAKMDVVLDGIMKLGKALTDAGKDCKKMTAAVKAAAAGLNAAAKDVEKFRDVIEKDPAADAWTDEYADKKMGDMKDPFMAAATACKDDKDFAAAMGSLELFKKAKKSAPDDVKAVEEKAPAPTK